MTGSPSQLDVLLGSDWRDVAAQRRASIAQRVGSRTDLVLFGTGYLGRHVLADLALTPFEPVAFVDNNRTLWGSEIEGIEVMSPEAAVQRLGQSALWLITIYTNSKVIDQCRSLGIPWVTCAELSWILPEPHPPMFVFGDPGVLATEAAEIAAAESVWADDDSRAEYRSQIRWRFLLDYSALAKPRPTEETYFPDDLVTPSPDEVFVDCGAFNGDSIDAFLRKRSGTFKRIIGIEPDRVNGRELQNRIDAWQAEGIGPIQLEPVAVGSSRGTLSFDTTGTAGSRVGAGVEEVNVAPLDEILAGLAPTYIKFDVEGAERDALLGGTATIRAYAPVLAVCLYHKPADLWELPLLVRSFRPDYRLFVRRYSDERWETVLYAIPPERAVR